MASDRGNDLALLKQRKAGTGVAHFRTGRNVRSGDDVVVVGFPLRGSLASQTNVTTGIISATGSKGRHLRSIYPPWFEVWQVTPGNSRIRHWFQSQSLGKFS
jgi:S1-C subfamily serine protease